jgi:hypothetical protein
MNKADPETSTGSAADMVSGAERRMHRFLYLSDMVCAVLLFAVVGKSAGFGFVAGAALGLFNFAWLHRTSRNASDRLAGNAQDKGSAGLTGISLAFGMVARVALVTAAGYAIFRGSIQSFYGYLGGLGMPILAVFAEALYESWNAVRHRS